MAKAKEISIDDLVGSKKTKLVPPKKTKTTKKESEMTKFYQTTKFAIIATVAVTSLVIFGGYKLHEYVYNEGYNAAKTEQGNIKAQVTAQLKENQ